MCRLPERALYSRLKPTKENTRLATFIITSLLGGLTYKGTRSLKTHLAVVVFTLVAAVYMARPASAEEQGNQCGARGAQILQALYPQARKVSTGRFTIDSASVTIPADADSATSPYTMVCRQWPAQPQYLLVALPMLTRHDDDGETGDIEVAVLDNATLKPVARYRGVGMINDDTLRLYMLCFDTAPYRLFAGRVAFGLRVSLESIPSRVAQADNTGLWLFDLNGTSLQPIVEGLAVDQDSGDWDDAERCSGTLARLQRTLAVGSEKHQGAADILITTRTIHSETARKPDGQCDETEADSKVKHSSLHYDGRHYVIAKEMGVID